MQQGENVAGRRLAGKVVIVTGGTRGMGEALVRGIVAQGGEVVFGGRDAVAGSAIQDSVGAGARYVVHDVARTADWERVVGIALERFGKVTGLVNNAGLAIGARIERATDEQIAAMIGVNQLGVLHGMRRVAAPMRATGGGSIVNVGSAASLRAHAGVAAYAGTKAAVVGMSLAAAAEFAPDNIRVNVVHPGYFDTRLLSEASRGQGAIHGVGRTPLGRVARPDEIVGPVTFLLSDESSFVTGAQLTVDGGLTM